MPPYKGSFSMTARFGRATEHYQGQLELRKTFHRHMQVWQWMCSHLRSFKEAWGKVQLRSGRMEQARIISSAWTLTFSDPLLCVLHHLLAKRQASRNPRIM